MTRPPATALIPTFTPMGQSGFARIRRVIVRDPMAMVGITIVFAVIVLALFGEWIAPYPEQGAGSPRPSMRGLEPSAQYLLGTDQLGRDILSRIIMGTRPALVISVFVVALAMLIGIPLGAIAGYRGGWLDQVLMRITEVFQSFPPLLLAMVTVAILGPSLFNAGLALAISWWPWYARLVRAEAQALRDRPFVEAARATGVPTWRILTRHILRNCMTPIFVQATVDIGSVILAMGALAFIGLGAQPPAPDWGLMVNEGRGLIFDKWWVSTFPGLAIFVTVLGFNLIGDSLRDVFDPRSVKR